MRYATDDELKNSLKSLDHDFSTKELKKKSTEKLRDILNEVRSAVTSSSMSSMFSDLYYEGVSLSEQVTTKWMPKIKEKYDLTGFTETIKADPQIRIALKQLAIENNNLNALSPEMRIILGTVLGSVKTIAINKLTTQKEVKLQERYKRIELEAQKVKELEGIARENSEDPVVDYEQKGTVPDKPTVKRATPGKATEPVDILSTFVPPIIPIQMMAPIRLAKANT